MSAEPDFAEQAQPEQMLARLNEQIEHGLADEGHDHGEAVSVRSASHRGHEIVIRTRYEIEVDGRPFNPAFTVDLGGRVHYHGLPTQDFASMVDLVRKAIDAVPDDFGQGDDEPAEPGHHHPGGHHHGHGSEEPQP